ncbi:MAG: efflux RND transporter permease subunit, partial [Holophagales bacterium]|nr:efflux RND transporter permease subunit [Holophagales bacterium]
QGLDRVESLVEAGKLRLRPILLTSITTIFGLLPMAIGLGGESATWQPLATTIAAGLAVATLICLLVIPCLQAILDDGSSFLARIAAGRIGEGEAAAPTDVDQPSAPVPSPVARA